MTDFAPEDAHAAAERLATQQHDVLGRLSCLEEGEAAQRLLVTTTLTGDTREHWVQVIDDIANCWTHYEGLRDKVRQLGTIMQPGHLIPPDLAIVQVLVREAGECHTAIDAACSRVEGVVDKVDQVWTRLLPRIDDCAAAVREQQSVAEDLGLLAGQDQAVEDLCSLAGELDEVRSIARTDPLQWWPTGALDTTEVDRLVAECKRLRVELGEFTDLRARAPQRLDQVDSTLVEVRRLDQAISKVRDRVNIKIHTALPREAGSWSTDRLDADLAVARELYQRREWRQLMVKLPALLADATTLLTRAQAGLIESSRPLRERNELRGRLSAYRVKAAERGLIEDLDLERSYQRARTLLSAPCDLPAAAAAVAQYQDAVNRMLMDGHSP